MEFESVFVALGYVAFAVIAYTVMLSSFVPAWTLAATVSGASAPANPRFIFFFSTWCPWSKKARPQWDAFKNDLKVHPMTYGGQTVVLEEYDGDSNPELLKKHNVAGYPTFVIVTADGESIMKSPPTKDSLRAFLVSSVGVEKPSKLSSGTA